MRLDPVCDNMRISAHIALRRACLFAQKGVTIGR
jgi:hypothetical protein